ncbi:AAA family ATPase (plasmid) [Halorarum halophilum]|uniref:AAA family ATPase n=1 Tax=Halorarum halophilum TaxID=2743090 RepID=A0A7D5GF01_9EURY|nr:AAA family ATPase [Halobaculum halophilum]QLG30166.1 AAA family ATPase [Halobaculum halophilum]
MTVLALTGYPASGKSTAASILADADWPVVGMGDVLRDTVNWTTEDEVWDYAQQLRDEHGPHGVAVACADHLEDLLDDHELVVLEGTRNPAELEYLEAELGVETVVVWVAAPDESRVEWFAARTGRGEGYEDHDVAAQKLEERTDREHNAGMGEYFDRADAIVHNNRGLAELANEIVWIAWELTY